MPPGFPKGEIAGYRLEARIGAGGTTAVYRAHQARLNRPVAIKVFQIADVGGARFLERFREETRRVAALHHPNVLAIHDYGEVDGIAYLVMEYVAGGALAVRRSEAPLPVEEVLTLTRALGEALSYAHAHNVVHRNLKPSNILMSRSDWPLLVDFGLAGGVSRQAGVLQSSIIAETASYLSPEQVLGEEVDARTDIYSLGLVVYEFLTGGLPFVGKTVAQSMMQRLHTAPPSLREQVPAVTEALEAVLLRALAREPDARYPTMQAFLNDLRRAHGPTDAERGSSEAGHAITMRLSAHQDITGPRLFIATSGAALAIPDRDEVQIGRQDPLQAHTPDLDLEPYGGGSAGVSRQHARLLQKPDGWYIEDLRSTNGTHLNEVRLLPLRPVRIRSGDLLRFAQLTLVFEE